MALKHYRRPRRSTASRPSRRPVRRARTRRAGALASGRRRAGAALRKSLAPLGHRLGDSLQEGAKRGEAYLERPRQELRANPSIVRWLVVLALVWVTYHFVFSDRGLLTLYRLRQDARTVTASITQLEGQRDQLKTAVESLQNDDALEARVRAMGYAKDGELIYRLPNPGADTASP